jgi:hypothetical protein
LKTAPPSVLKLLVDWPATEGVRVQPVFAGKYFDHNVVLENAPPRLDEYGVNVDSIFVVPASCEEGEAATEGLLPVNQRIINGNEQSKI